MEVIHVARRVTDLERSKAFYLDGLGLTERWGFERDGTTHVYVGDEGVADIHLYEDRDNPEPVAAGGSDTIDADASVCLLVDEDVEGLFESLVESSGCRVVLEPSEITFESHRNVICFIEDPDGHLIELIERLEGPPPAGSTSVLNDE